MKTLLLCVSLALAGGTAFAQPRPRQERELLEDRIRERVRALRALVRHPSPDVTRMTQLADRIVANRQRIARLEEDGVRQARGVLTPQKGAIYVLVLAEIDRGIERQIRKAARRPEEADRSLPF